MTFCSIIVYNQQKFSNDLYDVVPIGDEKFEKQNSIEGF